MHNHGSVLLIAAAALLHLNYGRFRRNDPPHCIGQSGCLIRPKTESATSISQQLSHNTESKNLCQISNAKISKGSDAPIVYLIES